LPERGGSRIELRNYLNVATDDDFMLAVAWALAALRPQGPYPALVLMGEQGSAKSTTARTVRRLVDPSVSDLRAESREVRDLMVAATSGHVVALDNVSRLPDWLSDALCRLATGGGISARQLYTDQDEVILEAIRPVILTGITSIATRGDLLDRSILLTLPPVPDDRRRPEAELWARFDTARPRLLGALLDAMVAGLRRLPDVHLDRLPRMADFALWISACEPACPWPAGAFLAAYTGNRQAAVEVSIEGDPLADTVRALAPWEGTAADLLGELNRKVPEDVRRRKDWFSRPRQVADALRRLAPALRRVGIEVDQRRVGHDRRRVITIEKVGISSSASSASSASPDLQADPADDRRTQAAGSSSGSSAGSPNVSGPEDAADARNPSLLDEDLRQKVTFFWALSDAELMTMCGVDEATIRQARSAIAEGTDGRY
jgi:hypothetical protein